MTWKAALLAAVVVLTLTIASPASADFSVIYPDGSLGFEINLGFGLHAAAFWDIPGTRDIFVTSADAVSNPLPVPFFPGASGFAYWLKFLFFDELGRAVFDVYIDQGAGFFLVTRVAF
jgi:hypothetical protein